MPTTPSSPVRRGGGLCPRLAGNRICPENYNGDFSGTPVFIRSSNPIPPVPVEEVYATTNIPRDMGASVTEKIYGSMGHTINEDEINLVKSLVFSTKAS